ncbi:MAG: glutamine synthetase adenylyltransferase, partial [Chloroflexota bacterium]
TTPKVLQTLARLLGVSDFLWDDFLRMQHTNLFPVVKDVDALFTARSKATLQDELAGLLQQAETLAEAAEQLNAFKDREMFRIDMRQIQGHITEFGQFSGELTDLAEVVIEAAYQLALNSLQAQFGRPYLADGARCPVAICALGKCGGRELGFASDIELMVIFAGKGQTDGAHPIPTPEFYNRLTREISTIIKTKHEGIFNIDLQLRPYGKAGNMGVSLESFQRYFALEGDAWPYERQALVKLRPIAGDPTFCQQVVTERDGIIYNDQPFDIAAMRAMRERQLRHLVTAGTINAKFSPGGLVDIEYLVQALQMTHGHTNPDLRQSNTYNAIIALHKANLLELEDFTQLCEAHIFLRRLINALRMVRGHAKDLTVPSPQSDEANFLARRLDIELEQLINALTQHTTQVQQINSRLLAL